MSTFTVCICMYTLVGEERTFVAVDGEEAYKDQLEVLSPVPKKVVLKVGAQVKLHLLCCLCTCK